MEKAWIPQISFRKFSRHAPRLAAETVGNGRRKCAVIPEMLRTFLPVNRTSYPKITVKQH